jgi:F-type H+-transporting ATPase subunit delta
MASYVSRYARAFADVVLARRLDADKAISSLETMEQILASSHELRTLLQNPSVPGDQKLRLLDALTKRINAPKEVRNFLAILVDHQRLGGFTEIVKEVKEQLNDRLGIADAEVISARELGAEERRILEAQIAKTTGKTVRAHYSQDPAVLGGAIVRVGSTIYDGSVRGQLQKLKEQLASS